MLSILKALAFTLVVEKNIDRDRNIKNMYKVFQIIINIKFMIHSNE